MLKKIQEATASILEASAKLEETKKEFLAIATSTELSKEMNVAASLQDGVLYVSLVKGFEGETKLEKPYGLYLKLDEAKELNKFLTNLFSEE